ncbi:hypothetical protein ACFYU5_25760 [Nocardia aobensis]|uniref:Uncharacterized protein n=1 Tax=Nocardia aobensis TaxID=257277 RepID=A0ABW6P9N5_9NOCA
MDAPEPPALIASSELNGIGEPPAPRMHSPLRALASPDRISDELLVLTADADPVRHDPPGQAHGPATGGRPAPDAKGCACARIHGVLLTISG